MFGSWSESKGIFMKMQCVWAQEDLQLNDSWSGQTGYPQGSVTADMDGKGFLRE